MTAVEYYDESMKEHRALAKAVIVTAHPMETTRLLLLSANSTFPDGLSNSSGLVGKNYMGYKVEGMDKDISKLDTSAFKKMIQRVVEAYPNFKAVATTLRNAKTACVNDWGAVLYADGEFYDAVLRENLEIFDRIGGGDSFASGLIYAFLNGKEPAEAVNYGAAHGALAMTTPGDTTMATLVEVEKVMKSTTARVDR